MSKNPNSNLGHPRNKEPYKKKEYPMVPIQELQGQFEQMVKSFWGYDPHIKDVHNRKNHELEVRFNTIRGSKPLTKIDYDNVIHKLKSLGFHCDDPQGSYMLRIQSEFSDAKEQRHTSTDSNLRTEINGFNNIQEYCKHNDIKKNLEYNGHNVKFFKKEAYKKGEEKMRPVDFSDFNFRVSYQTEDELSPRSFIIKNILDKWDTLKKSFRYINRVTFTHSDLPINVDISILKNSSWDVAKKSYKMTYRTDDKESNIFSNPEVYEIELEVNNKKIGPATETTTYEDLLASIRKAIKYILMGLQGTNYPISYPEQKDTLANYMKLIMGDDYNTEKHGWVKTSNFIGPSSYTLQITNIAPINPDSNIPNIRNDYTVTDKADGERHLMYISEKGRIYLINSNMKVMFTGSITETKEIFNSIVDGEIVLHDNAGKFINLFAAFDIYFLNKIDVRSYEFVPLEIVDNPLKFRLILLKNLFRTLDPKSVVKGEKSPTQFVSKRFELGKPSIFSACNKILSRESEKMFDYKTDGLIFTPARLGVGSNKIGHAGPLKKITWNYSFKWKPPQYNTIDFLVRTIKDANGSDEITPIFQSGMNTQSLDQLEVYKKVVLCVGYDPTQHGYENPCQNVLDDKLPTFKGEDNEELYKPAEFVPTNPSEPGTGTTNIMLKKDNTGVNQMITKEGEVFHDDTIVEFSYEMTADKKWKWKPLRLRYDKTARYKQGVNEFGNSYDTANNNWHSIHNPITEEMIGTGNNIPDMLENDDIYYNSAVSSDETRGLRDFHNLFVKKKLITSVSRRDDILIDYACGKGGDFPKWIEAKLSFVFGIDVSKDNLENRKNGACARFLNFKRDFKTIPYALFVHGDSGANIKNGTALMNDKAVQITKAIFGEGTKAQAEKIGKGVERQFGKGEQGFNVSSCQFALHYFFKDRSTFKNYMINVSECTRLGGYFIGACYDGKLVFNMLKKKEAGGSVDIYDKSYKLWEIRKDYEAETFPDDISSIGYQISVYQESINKMFPEYLVNFDYLERVMENYGFKLLTRDEAKDLKLPEGSGLFSELFNQMTDEVNRNRNYKNEYGAALNMTANEKKISFLNRYFVYKKISNVNAEKVKLDEDVEEVVVNKTYKKNEYKKKNTTTTSTKEKEKEKKKEDKIGRFKKLSSKLILDESSASSSVSSPIELEIKEVSLPPNTVEQTIVEKVDEVKAAVTKTKKPKKINLILEE